MNVNEIIIKALEKEIIYRRKKVVEPEYIDVPVVMGDADLNCVSCPVCNNDMAVESILSEKHCLGFVWDDKDGNEIVDTSYVGYRDHVGLWDGLEGDRKKEYAKAVRFMKEVD